MTNRSKPVCFGSPRTETVIVSFWAPRTMFTEPRAFGRQVTPGVLTIVKRKPTAGLALLELAECAALREIARVAAAAKIAAVRPVLTKAGRKSLEKCDETDLSILFSFGAGRHS